MMMRSGRAIVIVTVCLVAAVAAIAYAAGKTTAPEVIRAQRFELVDAEGTIYAVLKVGHERGETGSEMSRPIKGPALDMYDESGNLRVRLHAGLERVTGPGLDLMHRNGWKPAIALSVHDGGLLEEGHGQANLVLTCEADNTRAGVHVSDDAGARLELRDDRGKTIWSRP